MRNADSKSVTEREPPTEDHIQEEGWEIVPRGMQDGGRFPQIRAPAEQETCGGGGHFEINALWRGREYKIYSLDWKHTHHCEEQRAVADEPPRASDPEQDARALESKQS